MQLPGKFAGLLMQPGFQILLPDDKAATYTMVRFMVVLLNLATFLFLLFGSAAGRITAIPLAGTILALATFAALLLQRLPHFTSLKMIETGLAFSAIAWALAGNFLFALVLGCFAILGFIVHRPRLLHVDTGGLRFPSFPAKQYSWQRVHLVLLKDDVFTFESADNHVLQVSLPGGQAIDEAEFNAFCAAQVQQAGGAQQSVAN